MGLVYNKVLPDSTSAINMDNREEWNRARWASRRGLLELDLLLSPFALEAFPKLDVKLRYQYLTLLTNDDQDLLSLIMDAGRPDGMCDPIITEIRRFHRL